MKEVNHFFHNGFNSVPQSRSFSHSSSLDPRDPVLRNHPRNSHIYSPPVVISLRDPLRISNVLGFRSSELEGPAMAFGVTPLTRNSADRKFYLSRLKRRKELRAADFAKLRAYRIKYREFGNGGNSTRITPEFRSLMVREQTDRTWYARNQLAETRST